MKRCIILCLLVLIIALLGFGCSASEQPVAQSSLAPAPGSIAPQAEAALDAAPAEPDHPVAGSTAPPATQMPQNIDESAVPIPILTPSDSRGQRRVYTVDLQLQTTEFMPGIRTLLNTVSEMDGFVERAFVQGRDLRSPEQERHARYTLRIHSDRLSEFLVVIEDNFNMLILCKESDDVTASYTHTDATLVDLRAQETRLLRYLENPPRDESERRDLEQRLSDTQSNIRNHERHQQTIDYNVIYSTINVHLFEVIFFDDVIEELVVHDPAFGDRLSEATTRSIDGFVAFFQWLLIVLIRILPILIVLGIIAVITIIICRKARKLKWKNKVASNANIQKAPYVSHTGAEMNNNGSNGDKKE